MDFSGLENTENNEEIETENRQDIAETVDPDYASALPAKLQSKGSLSEQQQDAKENAIQKIQNIVRKQFAFETHLKEQEIETIDQRIRQSKSALDRLRACVLARYYGMSQGFKDDNLTRTFSRGTWDKPRRSRRERARYNSATKAVKPQKRLNLSFASLLNEKSPGSEKLLPSVETKSHLPNLNLSLKPTNTEQESLSLSKVSGKPTSSEFTENSSSSTKLIITNGGSENASRPHVVKANALSLSGSLSQSGAAIDSTTNPSLASSTRGCRTTIKIGNTSQETLPSDVIMKKDHSTGNHLIGNSATEGIHSNASETQLSASLQTGSELVDTQTKQKIPMSVLSSHGMLTNEQEKQSSSPSSLKGIHASAIKDVSSQSKVSGSGSRFYVKKRVIIGNTSKYIAPEKREEYDKSTHKWMVYIRGPPDDPHIDTYIQKVWFFLHPSYRPNDIIEVSKAPFRLTRRGWGEFPIRVQLHFMGARNKRVDIIHELKLDKTYTGLQTLGAETVVDLEIDRKTFEDLGIPVPLEVTQETEPVDMTSKIHINANPGILKSKRECQASATGLTSFETGQFHSGLALKRPRLDTPLSSTASTPAGSRMNSRCPSPVLAPKGSFPLEDGLEDLLHSLARQIPLITPNKDVVNLPFSARSADQFLSWNIGKRRAAEWQRAAKIRSKLNKCAGCSKITTKGVMVWCRRFGYSPQENLVMDVGVEYCKICGKIIEQKTREGLDTRVCRPCTREECSKLPKMNLNSLTPVHEILNEIEEKQKLCNEITSQRDKDEDDVEIDVVGAISTTKKPSCVTTEMSGLLSIPVTPEQQWIRDTCNDIGISLRPVIIQGVEVHVVESVLVKIAMKFMENLLRKASSLNTLTESSLEPKLIVPIHVYQAVRALSLCDFLGSGHFGHHQENQPQ